MNLNSQSLLQLSNLKFLESSLVQMVKVMFLLPMLSLMLNRRVESCL